MRWVCMRCPQKYLRKKICTAGRRGKKCFQRNNNLPIRRASGELPGVWLLIDRSGICPFYLRGEERHFCWEVKSTCTQKKLQKNRSITLSVTHTGMQRQYTPLNGVLDLSIDSWMQLLAMHTASKGLQLNMSEL